MPVDTPLQNILVVEDNADIRAILKLALEKVGGLTVCACDSGNAALSALAEFRPQLVMLDVMMPDMDGPGLLKLLRARADTAAVPVVFLTAKATTQEVQELRNLGALDVIAKPFDPMTLHAKVKAVWAGFNPA
jgi:DNA-binding response OmpR family regulator